MKIFLRFVFLLVFSFGFIFPLSSFGDFIPVEDVFNDIDVNYKYYDELQELYNRGMIFPESDGKFHGEKLLERDEFVGISMEVICKKCIQPNTEDYFLNEYTGKYVFFDINEKNKYFYCVAEADAKDYVRGYDKDYVCENGTSKAGEKPFCPSNRITKEEAYAVILRNSKIWTIEENEALIQNINSGVSFPDIADDVAAKNIDGSPYTFYGYFKKALDYQITEYDKYGNPTVYKLLEKQDNKIYPKKYVTKEEFLYLAYVALKANNCKASVVKNNLALDMEILEKTCVPGSTDCQESDLLDPEDTYDFKPIVEGYCVEGIDEPEGYIWRFYNMDTGEKIVKYGKYIDNFHLPHAGVRRIYLRVIDKCGNTGEIFSTIVVDDVDGDIEIHDKDCTATGTCPDIDDYDDPEDTYDIDIPVVVTCDKGVKSYLWTLKHTATGETYTRTTQYIENFIFTKPGEWNITVVVKDNCGNSITKSRKVIIDDVDGDIEIHDKDCTATGTCPDIDDYDDPEDTYDIDIPVVVTCDKGVKSYLWTLIHSDTGTSYTRNTQYIENFVFDRPGERNISVVVKDNCGNTITKSRKVIIDDIEGDIEIHDKDCTATGTCPDIDDYDDPEDTYDIDIPVVVTCDKGVKSYLWTLKHTTTGETYTRTTQYIEDFVFTHSGEWSIQVMIQDNCGNTYNKTRKVIIDDLDGDIIIVDKSCTEASKCNETILDDPEDTYDIDIPVEVTCEKGINSYVWTLEHLDSGQQFTFTTKYIDDFTFAKYGERQISVKVLDNCGNTITKTKRITIADIGINVTIFGEPIIGYGPLLVNFEGFATGGDGKYVYTWDFADGGKGSGKIIDHVFENQGVYLVKLHVVDGEGKMGDASILIKVLPRDCIKDSDGDEVNDCDDACPFVEGEIINKGCPVLERICDEDCGCPPGYICDSQDKAICGDSFCRPIVVVNNYCLFDQKSDTIFGNIMCNTCPCNRFVDFLSDLRKCDIVFPAITSPNSQEIYSKGDPYTIYKR